MVGHKTSLTGGIGIFHSKYALLLNCMLKNSYPPRASLQIRYIFVLIVSVCLSLQPLNPLQFGSKGSEILHTDSYVRWHRRAQTSLEEKTLISHL